MSIRIRERPDSRQLHYGATGGGETLRFNVITTAGESQSDVWLYVLSQTTPYFDGFLRQDIKVDPVGGPMWTADVKYGTTGVGGGDQPLGGVGNDNGPPIPPDAPADDTTPLPPSWSFSIQAPRIHITQSITTIARYRKGGGAARDFQGKIGVGKDGKVEGCDIPPEAVFKFSKSWARATVTLGYYRTLAALAGRTNNAEFLGFAAGELLLLSASGQGTEGEKWTITVDIGVSFNEIIPSDGICDGLPDAPLTIPKGGWEYLWIADQEFREGNEVVVQPYEAHLEQVVRSGDFADIEMFA